MMPRETILAVYERGGDAGVELVERLFAQLADQQEQLRSQQETIASLAVRVNELEDRLAQNSRNSSKPGGQEGHPGRALSLVENPDRVVLHGLREEEGCEGCGRSLAEAVALGYERRQVVDVPPLLSLEVSEHQAQRKRCPGCGRITTAPFPEEASARGVGYGPRIEALSVYLM